MGIKFQIKSVASKAEKEGNEILRFSGESEAYRRVATRVSEKISEKKTGEPVLKFKTGLNINNVKHYYWFKEEEKKEVEKQLTEHLPKLLEIFGEDVLDERNEYFWMKEIERYKFPVTILTSKQFFDTDNIDHAILYFSIIGGAFIDIIAPNKDFAEAKFISHYLQLESISDDDEFESFSDKIVANANLAKLMNDTSGDALFMIYWTALYRTKGFAGLLKSTPKTELIKTLREFIEGHLVDKQKKKCAKEFNSYVEMWESEQTRKNVYLRAMLHAGEQYAQIFSKDGIYYTAWDVELGKTLDDCMAKLSQNKYSSDVKKLKEEVDKRWNL